MAINAAHNGVAALVPSLAISGAVEHDAVAGGDRSERRHIGNATAAAVIGVHRQWERNGILKIGHRIG